MLKFTQTIKFRLTLWYSLVLTLFLVLFSVTVYTGLYLHLASGLDSLLHNTVLVQLDVPGDDINSALYLEVPTSLWDITLEDKVKCLPSTEAANQYHKPVCPGSLSDNEEDALRSLNIEPIQRIKVGTDKNFVNETLEFLAKFLMLEIPLILLLAFLGGYTIAGTVLNPLKKIVETAEHIVHGTDLGMRINLTSGTLELKNLANTFDSMMDRIQVLFQRHRDFTSEASHELQTPLTIIKTNIEVAMQNKRLKKAEFKEMLDDIQSSVDRMSKLVDDMLLLSKMSDAPSNDLDFELVNLKELVEGETSNYRYLLPDMVSFDISIPKSINLMLDKEKFSRVITNLFTNSCKYSEEGTISISASANPKFVTILFSDTGQGISKDEVRYIFERFYRSDKARARKTGGVGLGLTIVSEIVHAHNGRISVDSIEKQGTTFTIMLPNTK